MPVKAVRLKLLLRQRHWQTYRTFCQQYDEAAAEVDPRLLGSWPSRVQLHRWVSGGLRGLPYPDHCRVLEHMFPGFTAEKLFELIPIEDRRPDLDAPGTATEHSPGRLSMEFVASGGDLVSAMADVVRNAGQCVVAIGSRSREPSYLQEIEKALVGNPSLIHYRILIGPPHSQILKDHLLQLLELRNANNRRRKTIHIGILTDPVRDYERFFVASERTAVVVLPSINSPMNFDTGLVIHDPKYAQGLLQHGMALYGGQKLESAESIERLEVLQ